MKFLTIIGFLVLTLTGCTAPKFSGSFINTIDGADVVIIKDKETTYAFQESIENWLLEHGYKYEINYDGRISDSNKIDIKYKGIYAWDLTTFLHKANITAYYNNEIIGEANYIAQNNLNFDKFTDDKFCVYQMMDVVFGKTSVNQENY